MPGKRSSDSRHAPEAMDVSSLLSPPLLQKALDLERLQIYKGARCLRKALDISSKV